MKFCPVWGAFIVDAGTMPVEMAAKDVVVVNRTGPEASVGIAASPFADSKLSLNSIADYFIRLSCRKF
jgi:hypothetical protein